MLTPELVKEIDRAREAKGESRSEYLRRAAVLRLHEKQERRARLTELADMLIGSIHMKTHPVWKNERKVEQWRKEIRKEWK